MNRSGKSLGAFVLLSVLTAVTAATALSQSIQRYRVEIQHSVRVKMRDGVLLAADVYVPVSEERFPVLLERTPYNRADEAAMANELASHGYVVVLQDTRGRYE